MENDGTLRLFDQLVDKQRQQLTDLFTQREETIAACTAVMRETISVLRQRDWRTHEYIWNACLFVNVVAHDLSILIPNFASERNEWRRRFIARSLALVLYEIAEDVPAVLGKGFQKALVALAVSDQLRTDLRDAQKAITEFWDANRELLKEIRDFSAAHRHHDAMAQLDVIYRIDMLKLLGLGLDLGNHLNTLGARAQAIIDQTSTMQPPEMLS